MSEAWWLTGSRPSIEEVERASQSPSLVEAGAAPTWTSSRGDKVAYLIGQGFSAEAAGAMVDKADVAHNRRQAEYVVNAPTEFEAMFKVAFGFTDEQAAIAAKGRGDAE